MKRSLSTRSSLGPRSGGGNETPSVASASPYTGAIASGLNPKRAKRFVNASIVSGDTGSAPLKAKRQVERSTPAMSSSRILRKHSS
jgi:hypothetical protein